MGRAQASRDSIGVVWRTGGRLWASGSRVVIFVVVLAAAALLFRRAEAAPTWSQLTSDHFVMRTDLDAAEAEETIRKLEETRAAMLAMVWGGAAGPPGRAPVIAFRTERELSVFSRGTFRGRYVEPYPFQRTLVLAGPPAGSSLEHELAHHLSTWFLPICPDWYSEGLACFLETIRYNRKQQTAYLGEPALERFRVAQASGDVTMAQLFGERPVGPAESSRWYASTWKLVHYLISRRLEAFERFQRRLGALEPARQAWKTEFPDLDAEHLSQVLAREQPTGVRALAPQMVPRWQGRIQVRPLTAAEVHVVRGFAFAYLMPIGKDFDPALVRSETSEALREDPTLVDAVALEVFLPGVVPDHSKVELADRTARAHPESWLAWLTVVAANKQDQPVALGAATRALALAPDERAATIYMANVRAARGEWVEAAALGHRALALHVAHDEFLMFYVATLASTGRCDDAAAWAARLAIYLPPKKTQMFLREWRWLRQICFWPPRPSGSEKN